jgi:hypothetical protein
MTNRTTLSNLRRVGACGQALVVAALLSTAAPAYPTSRVYGAGNFFGRRFRTVAGV